VPLWIDLSAVAVGALAGAGMAARRRFDVVGVLILAALSGLGGGIVRDVLLAVRPVAVTNDAYLPTVAVAALVGLAATRLLDRWRSVVVTLDTFSIALFTLVGVEKALLYDLEWPAAVFIGICSGVGGGILVDLLAGRPVEVVHRGPWNATAALLGGLVYAVLAAWGAPTGVAEAACIVVVVAARLASLRWGLETPLPEDVGRALARRSPLRRAGDEDTPRG
jgi:uncharacterized membrane protein YeiH